MPLVVGEGPTRQVGGEAVDGIQGLDVGELLARHREPGLYVIFADGHEVDLSHPAVERAAQHLLTDEAAIPPERRAAAEFQPCRVCPARDETPMCHALPAILPFLDEMDRHDSHEGVVAVYVDRDEVTAAPVLHMSRTSLQRALQFVAIQSVIRHCEMGRTYFGYFGGVIPFVSAESIAERVYANVLLAMGGDRPAAEAAIEDMREKLLVTMHCQVRRVKLVAQSDAFVNAFVNLHMALEMLRPATRAKVRAALLARKVEGGA